MPSKKSNDGEDVYDSVEVFKAEGNYYAMFYRKSVGKEGRSDWPTLSLPKLVLRQEVLKEDGEPTTLEDAALAEIRARIARDSGIIPPTLQ